MLYLIHSTLWYNVQYTMYIHHHSLFIWLNTKSSQRNVLTIVYFLLICGFFSSNYTFPIHMVCYMCTCEKGFERKKMLRNNFLSEDKLGFCFQLFDWLKEKIEQKPFYISCLNNARWALYFIIYIYLQTILLLL